MAQASSQALDALEATVNAVLLHTGSVFNDPASCESHRLTRTTAQTKYFVPYALQRFHTALDDLEGELVRAKTILRRDLATSRSVRKRTTPPSAPAEHDVVMVDVESASQELGTQESTANGTLPEEMDSAQEVPKTTSGQVGEDVTANTRLDETLDHKNVVVEDMTIHGPEQQPQSTKDEAESRPNEADANGALEDGSTRSGHEVSTAADNEGVGSLLPGLEMYANDAGVDGLDEMKGLGEFSPDQGLGGSGELGEQGAFDMLGFPDDFGEAETNFDDLFKLTEFGNDADGQTNGLDDPIDESFFNLDGA